MSTIQGSWQINIRSTSHFLMAELSSINHLSLYFDDHLIHKSSYIIYPQGEIYNFEREGYDFVLRIEGVFRPRMSFKLFMNGQEVAQRQHKLEHGFGSTGVQEASEKTSNKHKHREQHQPMASNDVTSENETIRSLMIDLRRKISRSFNEDELRDLCFDMGIDYENLPAIGKSGKVRELVLYCHRIGIIADLINTCHKLRPNIVWPNAI